MKPDLFADPQFFLFRAPSYSITALKKFHSYGADIPEQEAALLRFFGQDFANEALYVASPVLHERLTAYLTSPLSFSVSDKKRLLNSLYKYYVRCHSRSVPFGLFAGFSHGSFVPDGPTDIRLKPLSCHERKLRFDAGFLYDLSRQILSVRQLRKYLTFKPNSSLYRFNDQFRYAEFLERSGLKKYVLTNIELTDYLSELLELCRSGSSLAALKSHLVQHHHVDMQDAEIYLDELIEAQIIVSDVTPNVTGEPYIERLLTLLRSVDDDVARDIYLSLDTALQEMASPGAAAGDIEKKLRGSGLSHTSPNFLQVDLVLNLENCVIDSAVARSIVQALPALTVFSMPRVRQPLEDFKLRFREKFGNTEVPLALALDPESGILFNGLADHTSISGLTDDIRVYERRARVYDQELTWNAAQDLLLDKYIAAVNNRTEVIVLTAEEMRRIRRPNVELPDSAFAFGSFLAEENGRVKFQMKVLDGPPSSKLLGRFCAHDPHLTTQVRDLLLKEEMVEEDAVYAEVVYVSQDRAGNVLIRPHLRKYEIPYMGMSTLPAEQQIPINDLYLSVRDGKLILRSGSLNKKVIPRESSAYYPTAADLPVYIFMSYLYVEEYPDTLAFNWNEALIRRPFLPRVEYQDIILSPATWNLNRDELQSLLSGSGSAISRIRPIAAHYRLPLSVSLRSGDNEMLLQLDNEMSCALLLEEIKNKKFVTLTEDLFSKSIAGNNAGEVFANEVVIPLSYDDRFLDRIKRSQPLNSLREPDLMHLPGGEFLYLKIYLGTRYSDQFLSEVMAPFVSDHHNRTCFTSWFFIRYSENGYHLRIRFKNAANPARLSVLLERLNPLLSGLMRAGQISDYRLAVYEQETSVYSMAFMEPSEAIFGVDSRFALDLLQVSAERIKSSSEFLLAVSLLGIHDLLDLFGFAEQEKIVLINELAQSYFNEFGGNKSLKVQLDHKFRLLKNMLIGLFTAAPELSIGKKAAFLLRERRAALQKEIVLITGHPEFEERFRHQLPERYIHLFINRLFRSSPRKNEMLIYHLMGKLYLSLGKIREKRG